MVTSKQEMIRELESLGVLQNPKLKLALEVVDRKLFVPDDLKEEAYKNIPLPIGFGQTISQPYTVVFMLELLDVFEGAKVLDIGSGSGWSTALLGFLVGEKGGVIGLERIPELVEFGQENLNKFDFPWAKIMQAQKQLGIPGEKFDRILVSAETNSIPQELVDQLKDGGIMVIPISNSIVKIKKENGKLDMQKYDGFSFVPLVKD